MQLATSQRRAISAALKAHLKSKKLTFSSFAKESGINNNTLSKLTQPDKFDSVQSSTKLKLEKSLGIKWEQLVGESDAAPQVARHANGRVKHDDHPNGSAMKRMLVIELCGSRINIPAGVEVSILDGSTIRVR